MKLHPHAIHTDLTYLPMFLCRPQRKCKIGKTHFWQSIPHTPLKDRDSTDAGEKTVRGDSRNEQKKDNTFSCCNAKNPAVRRRRISVLAQERTN